MGLQKKLKKLQQSIDDLRSMVSSLKEENAELRNKISELEVKLKSKKNSTNSSVPPSQDQNRKRKNTSLRKKTDRKSGGQPGHKGTTLEMNSDPDHIEFHVPYQCSCCGELLDAPHELIGKRQVIDIPPISPTTTEHQIYSVQCKCGILNKGHYPNSVTAPVCYGSNIEVLINYLSTRQYLSIVRIAEFFHQVLGVKLSQGTIVNKLDRFTNKCREAYEDIRQNVSKSKVVGADETGCVVNGGKHWMWTWQTPSETFIAVSPTRGFRAIEDNFPEGLQNSILVSDCWAAQLKTKAKARQICIAHLQRELIYFTQLDQEKWSSKFLKLLQESLKLKTQMKQKLSEGYKKKVRQIFSKARQLLEVEIKGPPKLLTLKNRLIKRIDCLWTFLYYYDVPPDNNASERAIRNVKVKQKVSGQFKSFNGAENFAITRSIIDTAIKRGLNVFTIMDDIAQI